MRMNMKNTYNIFIKTVAVIAVVLGLCSCLEKEPTDYILESEAMQTYEDAEQTVTGIYSALKSGALSSGYLTLLPDIQADLVYAVEGFSNTYGSFWQWDIRTTWPEIESVYAGLYTVIGRCNFYLDKVDTIRASLTDDEKLEALDYYTGEVYCARAFAYSELLKCFCKAYDPATAADDMGLVLRSSYFKSEPVKRASLKDSYAFVLADLAKAEELLDEENDYYNSPYFTQAAAYALHARVTLYMQDWQSAIDYSSKVIDSEYGEFSLASASTIYTSDQTFLDYLWTNDSSFEIIWRIGFTDTSYGGSLGAVFLNYTKDFISYYPDYVPAQWALNLYGSSDGRYSAYFASGQTGYPHGLTWPLLIKYYGNESLIASYIYQTSMPKPFRLAEQYLIRAEAYCNQGGQYSKAAADLKTLNMARSTTGTASVNLTEDNWKDVISNERVKELYMEGFRLHDLKRWGKGFERTPQTSSLAEGSSLKIKADDHRFVWPIPQHEIEAPGSQIVQNAGY